MNLDAIILLVATFVTLVSVCFIPKKDIFKAQFVFLFVQLPSWVLGLLAVQLRLLEYPYRELSKVNRTSFIFEYLVLPIICIHFNSYYPSNASKLKKFGAYIGTSLSVTIAEVILEKYTRVIAYTVDVSIFCRHKVKRRL